MKTRSLALVGILALASAAAAWPAVSVFTATGVAAQSEPVAKPIMPTYASDGALQLPQDWRQWVFAGSSLGLSYTQGAQPGMEMFHETLMEPSAYKHFAATGTFREGTMLVLALHGTGEGVLPSRRGRFAAELHGVEMAVKDSSRRPEGWAYYNFGGMDGLRNTARAMPKESCYSCHIQHAKRDNVFVQFYPLLEEVAPRPRAAHVGRPAGRRCRCSRANCPGAVRLTGSRDQRARPSLACLRAGGDGQAGNHRCSQGTAVSVRQRAEPRPVRG